MLYSCPDSKSLNGNKTHMSGKLFLIQSAIVGFETTRCVRESERNGKVDMWIPNRQETRKNNWLVVWNMAFIFPHFGNVIIPIDEL